MSGSKDSSRWVRVAEEDFLALKAILAGNPVAWGVACYLSQQAGEKILKAYLAAQNRPIRKIHDLGALLGECTAIEPSLADLRADCEMLTPHWIRSRYPDDLPYEATEKEGRTMLEAAKRIRSRILPLIK